MNEQTIETRKSGRLGRPESAVWGGAFLLNLSPNRSFLPHPERELHQILAQLLPLVGGPR